MTGLWLHLKTVSKFDEDRTSSKHQLCTTGSTGIQGELSTREERKNTTSKEREAIRNGISEKLTMFSNMKP
ncbi:hypothetical protein TIFTF001_007854 [Ficus carica]|uniref:Uncharacterized protein n=1 Tax=Ficus carica TaxID=3494 RepID=A0AA88D189_FICCA|nr:hypothetical protein TIFTF001_007854 [Ficus carica]